MTAKRTVLVVEVDDGIRSSLRQTLEEEAYQVVAFDNGGAALEWLSARPAPELPCAALVDVVMPGMDGAQLVAAMRSADAMRRIPIVMMTSLMSPHARLPPGVRLLRKPFRVDPLLGAVEDCCGLPPL